MKINECFYSGDTITAIQLAELNNKTRVRQSWKTEQYQSEQLMETKNKIKGVI